MIRGVSTGFAYSRKLTPFFAAAVFVGVSGHNPGVRRKRARRGQDALTQMDHVEHSVVHIWRKTRRATGIFHFIGLVGSLALLISIASPADDAVQHELAPGTTRHSLRQARAHRADAPLIRGIAVPTAAVVSSRKTDRWISRPARNILVLAEIRACPTGDRPPPHTLL